MSSKGKGGNTVAAVWALAEPLAQQLGLTLWDIRFVKEGASWYLRVFVEKEGGVSVDDCVAMSHALDGPLDETDPIEQNYYLEVSSPGLERELTRDEHFQALLGARIKVRLIRPVDQVRDFTGELLSFDNGAITLLLENGTQMQLQKKRHPGFGWMMQMHFKKPDRKRLTYAGSGWPNLRVKKMAGPFGTVRDRA